VKGKSVERDIFNEEHIIFRDAFRKFVAKEIEPYLEEWEENGIVPRDLWKKMGENGFLCPWLEEKYGGSGADFLYSVIINEELARVRAFGIQAGLHSDIVVHYLNSQGNEAQKAKWLPGCARGEIITAVAMTEPDAGSDLAAIRTTAVRNGDNQYILNGQKTFISNGINSDLVVVVVKTNPSLGYKGISLICVEDGTPGFIRGRKLKKMGWHSQDTAELIFDNCVVPASNLLGEEGKGFYYLMDNLQGERLINCLLIESAAEAMLELTVKYCRERVVFGSPVSSLQHNAFKIVEMATEIELGRIFVDQLVSDHMAGKDIVKRVSMGKYWLAEMANRVAYTCVQLHGGYGYMEEYPICRFARDIRPFTIFAGSTEIMKVIIAKMMNL
jgi:acyl-CoA dehydrogenase